MGSKFLVHALLFCLFFKAFSVWCRFFVEKGVILSLDEVEELADGGIVARPHFARVMLDHVYVSTVKEAFDQYLDTNEYQQRIERFKACADECIHVIHQSGGKAVLAHPYQLKLPDDALESLIASLKYAGLDAIECYYPKHTPAMVQKLLALASKFSLHITAGSDFHGEAIHPDRTLAPVFWISVGFRKISLSENPISDNHSLELFTKINRNNPYNKVN